MPKKGFGLLNNGGARFFKINRGLCEKPGCKISQILQPGFSQNCEFSVGAFFIFLQAGFLINADNRSR